MHKKLLPADTFIVLANTILEDKYRGQLIMLYQPIIGAIPINLYYTLWSFLDKMEIISKETTHHNLLANTGLNLDILLEAREKLEAIGLLKTYVKNNEYIYELYSPLSAVEFLTNPVLATALLANVGKLEYENIVDYYKKPAIKLDEYKDISTKFTDVFKFYKSDLISEVETNLRKTNYQKLRLASDIDISSIISLIPDEILSFNSLTKEDKELIYNLSFIYNLTEEQLSEIIINSTTNKKLDRKKLRRNAGNYYSLETGSKMPMLAYYTQPEFLQTKLTNNDKRSKQIYMFETTSPYDFLNNKSQITKREQELLEYLLIDLKFTPGVTNVLLDYALKTNNNKLIKGYIEVIASQWQKSKIKTVPEAMEIAEKEYKQRKEVKTKTNKNKTVEHQPEWLDQKLDKEELSPEEEAELKKLLEDI